MMQLAREFRRPDWRRMLSEISASELGEWAAYFSLNSFSDALLDAEFATLKALVTGLVTGAAQDADDFRLLSASEHVPEKTDDELMRLGEGITGGVRYGPDYEPGH
ncbi:phage tail assembly protein T [Salmonella enterica subsp. enterica]|uniref:Phage tail assembly protein T n=1 Tax=Salmonella enterica TaxID=28901 RepID=A0A5U4D0L9_SALER|nr:phage tail assembly protein T [Salmonella enterica subsp. enterica]EBP8538936.1 phage tail assembly protein T [Salmonella enterica]EBT4151924.1 phage tail assembly protein T [Salmonella enterica subsp. enterica]EED9464499.1 phage tail assembly protein T [Salmonella enterica subsp. enterica serovar Abaetetuba]EEN6707939.1 phage tail assembly protein T [Salmonella enterica subsp. enterica serovar Rubislaw]